MHSKHRQRMREKLLAGGEFAPHETLEMLLTFAIPRKNTNDIAHRLLQRFGSMDAVFSAPYEELIEVRGMGTHSAILIRTVALLQQYSPEKRGEPGECLDSIGKLSAYGKALFEGMTEEAVYAVLLDSRLCLVDCVCLADGSRSDAEVRLFDIAACPSLSRSTAAVIFHNHPDGNTAVSDADRDFVGRTAELFAMRGVEVIEHFVVAGDSCVAHMKSHREDAPER